MATKWSILVSRRDALQSQLDTANAYLEGLDATECGLTCDGCGEVLATEGDFARHFTIPDSRYLNLGSCPVKDALTGDPWHPDKLNNRRCPKCHLYRPVNADGTFSAHGCGEPASDHDEKFM